ncbi:fimbrial protein [Pseudocitrobacter cyperus]|uniref:Fimbrial protein n=1 Tax=Pseudocitrobacter cyperus TaxID=3112843 RepID=A0ABV0HPF6_9ENTR
MMLRRKWWLVATLFTSGVANASCILGSDAISSPLYMDMGRVMVQPQTPPGTVIASRSWPLRDKSLQLQCNGSQNLEAKVIASGSRETGNHIWSTNVPGIGLRFTLQRQAQQVSYPGKITVGGGSKSDVSLNDFTFKLDVIKTANLVGSGAVAAGQYTTFGNGKASLINTWLRDNSLIIVSPSCRISNNANFRVNLGSIPLAALKGKGTGAGGRNFAIRMQCAGNVSVAGTRLNMTFDGNIPDGVSPALGVLRNESRSKTAAEGIGVQIMDENRRPVPFRQANPVATLNSAVSQFIDLRYFARFYQYQARAQAGDVSGHMVFNVSYD